MTVMMIMMTWIKLDGLNDRFDCPLYSLKQQYYQLTGNIIEKFYFAKGQKKKQKICKQKTVLTMQSNLNRV